MQRPVKEHKRKSSKRKNNILLYYPFPLFLAFSVCAQRSANGSAIERHLLMQVYLLIRSGLLVYSSVIPKNPNESGVTFARLKS